MLFERNRLEGLRNHAKFARHHAEGSQTRGLAYPSLGEVGLKHYHMTQPVQFGLPLRTSLAEDTVPGW